ncbi:hypothetical protein HK102_010898, partial [Quaeritorhiza haematococci]
HYLMHRENAEAHELAVKTIASYPNVPYLYYAAAYSAQEDEVVTYQDMISFCEKGLSLLAQDPSEVSSSSSYIRLELLRLASESFEKLAYECFNGRIRYNEQVEDLESALCYAEKYIGLSASDERNLGNVIAHAVRMMIMVRNNSFYEDEERDGRKSLVGRLGDMEHVLQCADMVVSCMEPPEDVDQENYADEECEVLAIRGVADLIFKNTVSLVEWAKRFEDEWEEPEEDDIDILPCEDSCGVDDTDDDEENANAGGDDEAPVFRFCSCCGSRGADLKLCLGCLTARYCDAECQKSHWKGHKDRCNASGDRGGCKKRGQAGFKCT